MPHSSRLSRDTGAGSAARAAGPQPLKFFFSRKIALPSILLQWKYNTALPYRLLSYVDEHYQMRAMLATPPQCQGLSKTSLQIEDSENFVHFAGVSHDTNINNISAQNHVTWLKTSVRVQTVRQSPRNVHVQRVLFKPHFPSAQLPPQAPGPASLL